jgi:ribosomal-protein-alanine N-acetyltransferase
MRKPREDERFEVRPIAPEDLEQVLDIEARAFKHPWSPELLKRELTHEWSTILVAEEPGPDGRRIVGFAIFWVVHDELHILNVATAPEHRNRGIARTVIRSTLERARARKCTLATLEVRKSNEAAIHLYKGFGFRPVGVRPNYYVDEGEDAIVMILDL